MVYGWMGRLVMYGGRCPLSAHKVGLNDYLRSRHSPEYVDATTFGGTRSR